MNETFQPNEIEQAVQQAWAADDVYRVTEDESREKFYACSMLPYPSGKLHMGHVRNYTINDMLTRYLRMNGKNVLMPMGWDAFGLPAENAAMKNGVPPAQWTYDNIAYMKKQMQSMGLAIDWSREVATCQPSYYKWNQWLFIKMLERGICERRTQTVNWDPVDQTVLANEQVVDGRGWRSGALVEKREIPGYYLKITDYAPELLEHVQNGLEGWPERVRLMQENWIGKSAGVRFAFTHDIKNDAGELIQDGKMYVFTTRPDTIMGVTFCAVAAEHPLAEHAAKNNPELQAFIEKCKAGGQTEAEVATREKEGMNTGLQVQHPLTGEMVDLWVGNYVLMSYGDGAVMAVPAHDERDFSFANKYDLPIKQVVTHGQDAEHPFDSATWQDWYATKEGTCINSAALDGMDYPTALDKVAELLSVKDLGEKQTTWRLRDWGISRQRYWGTPIPMIHCEDCGAVPVPEQDLPVVLPEECVPDGSGNPLKTHAAFHAGVTCPNCGKPARRETDTMDTFIDSSWYYMAYCNSQDMSEAGTESMTDARTNYWMRGGMDQYIGGIEHAILHLLYARFWTKIMRDMGLVECDEPFKKLLTQGMVLNHVYSRKNEKGGIDYFWPHEVENVVDADGKVTGAKLIAEKDGLPAGTAIEYGGIGTMSKSKNNGVDPQALIDEYGADTARVYTMFTAPPEATLEWNDSAVEGAHRFIRRVYNLARKYASQSKDVTSDWSGADKAVKELRFEVHTVLKQIDFDFQRMQYNTTISGCMKLLNALEGFKQTGEIADAAAVEGVNILLRTLYPAAPHVTSYLWKELGFETVHGTLLDTAWPTVDDAALVQDEIELMLQVNGKLRGKLLVAADANKAAIEQIALTHEAYLKQADGKAHKKIIVVPGRLVNVVV